MNIIGSIMTGTHGSGIHNQPMSSFVKEIAFIDPNGKQRRLAKDKDNEEFTRFLHSFGTLGIVF
jgi:xylitol oxidase